MGDPHSGQMSEGHILPGHSPDFVPKKGTVTEELSVARVGGIGFKAGERICCGP